MLVAAACSDGSCTDGSGRGFDQPVPIWVIAVTVVGWHLLLVRLHMYDSRRLASVYTELRDAAVALAIVTGIMCTLTLFAAPQYANRPFILTFVVALASATLLSRIVMRATLAFLRTRGRNLRTAVIAGSGIRAQALAKRMAGDSAIGYRLLGYVDASPRGAMPGGLPLLGGPDDLAGFLAKTAVDEVVSLHCQ